MVHTDHPLKTFLKNVLHSPNCERFKNHIIGAGSVFNVSGQYYDLKKPTNDQLDDFVAIWSDWHSVGCDLRHSIRETSCRIKRKN